MKFGRRKKEKLRPKVQQGRDVKVQAFAGSLRMIS